MRLAALFAFAFLPVSCSFVGSKPAPCPSLPEQTAGQPAASAPSAETLTRVEMVNVNIRLDPEMILRIRRLAGRLIATRKGQTPSFDDKLSYVVEVSSAEIGVTAASLTHMMNTYVFGEADAPLKHLRLSVHGGRIKQEGTIKKGIGIPFETIGDVSPTAEGKIRIHPTKMKAGHLPVKGLMKLFGVDMAKLINTRNARGISVDDNDIILDPALALPPPKMRGMVTAVRVEGDEIVQIFGTEKPGEAKKLSGGNYMWYHGGVLKFGKLTMHDTDLRMVDADPRDPFDFSPEHYNDHLVAGYSKTTASGGLIVHMPDYTKISKSLSPR